MLIEGRGCRCLSPSLSSFFPSLRARWVWKHTPGMCPGRGDSGSVKVLELQRGEDGKRGIGLTEEGLWEVLGDTCEETVKIPEVGRWLFYSTLYRSKFPSLLCCLF